MATITYDNREILRRTHELEVQTHRDKARFAAWVGMILFFVLASLVLGFFLTGY